MNLPDVDDPWRRRSGTSVGARPREHPSARAGDPCELAPVVRGGNNQRRCAAVSADTVASPNAVAPALVVPICRDMFCAVDAPQGPRGHRECNRSTECRLIRRPLSSASQQAVSNPRSALHRASRLGPAGTLSCPISMLPVPSVRASQVRAIAGHMPKPPAASASREGQVLRGLMAHENGPVPSPRASSPELAGADVVASSEEIRGRRCYWRAACGRLLGDRGSRRPGTGCMRVRGRDCDAAWTSRSPGSVWRCPSTFLGGRVLAHGVAPKTNAVWWAKELPTDSAKQTQQSATRAALAGRPHLGASAMAHAVERITAALVRLQEHRVRWLRVSHPLPREASA